MCLIIKKPSNAPIGEELLERAQKQNKDGWGIMWAQDNRVNTIKGFGLNSLVEAVNNPDFAASEGFVHLRWGTSGLINDDNCHPFRVTDYIYMMHNGVFNINTPHKEMSDTWHFVKRYLRPMLVSYPDAFLDPTWIDDVEEFVGSNKIIILNAKGESGIINEKMWRDRDGLLLSNLNSCPLPVVHFLPPYVPTWEQQLVNYKKTTSVPTAVATISKEQSGSVVKKETSAASALESSLQEEYDSRYNNRQFAKQVANELSERGITEPDGDSEYEWDGDDEDASAELMAYYAASNQDSPTTLKDLYELDYEELQGLVLKEPELIAAIIWRADAVGTSSVQYVQ